MEALLVAFIIFGPVVMGGRNCSIQIQNGGQGQLTLKTFQLTPYDEKFAVDSIVLRPNEKMDIGRCISCSIPDTLDINFDAIGFYDNHKTFKLMYRGDLIKYLETLDKEDCITYIVP